MIHKVTLTDNDDNILLEAWLWGKKVGPAYKKALRLMSSYNAKRMEMKHNVTLGQVQGLPQYVQPVRGLGRLIK